MSENNVYELDDYRPHMVMTDPITDDKLVVPQTLLEDLGAGVLKIDDVGNKDMFVRALVLSVLIDHGGY